MNSSALHTVNQAQRFGVRAALGAVIISMFAALAAGCFANEIVDEFSTEITVIETGFSPTPFEVRKRYRFSRDPATADRVTIQDLSLQVVPLEHDLSFIQQTIVYVELDDGTRVPVAVGDGFRPGEFAGHLDIIYHDNLADLLQADGRLVLVWYIEPNIWYREFPAEGMDVIGFAAIGIVL